MKRSELDQFDYAAASAELAKVQASLAIVLPLLKKLQRRRAALDARQRQLLVSLWEYDHSHERATVDNITPREVDRLAAIMNARLSAVTR